MSTHNQPPKWLLSLGPELGPAWGGLLRTHSQLIAGMGEELMHAHGLSLNDYDVLRQLALVPGKRLRMAELAERVVLTRPGLTGVVNRLEEAGLVERRRAEDDGRGLIAHLTPEGTRRLQAAHATHVESIRRHFAAHLDRDDLRALHRVWTKLAVDRPSTTDPGNAGTQ